MTEPNLRERMASAMKERASRPLYNIPSLDPVLVGSLGDAWPYLADAALSAFLSSPITEEEVEAAARAIFAIEYPDLAPDEDVPLGPPEIGQELEHGPCWRYCSPEARAAITAYRTVIGRKG